MTPAPITSGVRGSRHRAQPPLDGVAKERCESLLKTIVDEYAASRSVPAQPPQAGRSALGMWSRPKVAPCRINPCNANSFMVFSNRFRALLRKRMPNETNGNLSKALSQLWSVMPDLHKATFRAAAKKLRQEAIASVSFGGARQALQQPTPLAPATRGGASLGADTTHELQCDGATQQRAESQGSPSSSDDAMGTFAESDGQQRRNYTATRVDSWNARTSIAPHSAKAPLSATTRYQSEAAEDAESRASGYAGGLWADHSVPRARPVHSNISPRPTAARLTPVSSESAQGKNGIKGLPPAGVSLKARQRSAVHSFKHELIDIAAVAALCKISCLNHNCLSVHTDPQFSAMEQTQAKLMFAPSTRTSAAADSDEYTKGVHSVRRLCATATAVDSTPQPSQAHFGHSRGTRDANAGRHNDSASCDAPSLHTAQTNVNGASDHAAAAHALSAHNHVAPIGQHDRNWSDFRPSSRADAGDTAARNGAWRGKIPSSTTAALHALFFGHDDSELRRDWGRVARDAESIFPTTLPRRFKTEDHIDATSTQTASPHATAQQFPFARTFGDDPLCYIPSVSLGVDSHSHGRHAIAGVGVGVTAIAGICAWPLTAADAEPRCPSGAHHRRSPISRSSRTFECICTITSAFTRGRSLDAAAMAACIASITKPYARNCDRRHPAS
eukprot:Opistho-2@50183